MRSGASRDGVGGVILTVNSVADSCALGSGVALGPNTQRGDGSYADVDSNLER